MDKQEKPKVSAEPIHQPGTGKAESKARQEGKEAGRYGVGPRGRAKRPAAKATGRHSSGVSPVEPIDPQSPNLQPP
jgi:hypothetical protein